MDIFENRILLIGNTGQLGWELQRTLSTLGQIFAVDYPEINLSDPNKIRNIVRSVQPHVIINAAAYTAVDQAEKEVELAQAINGTAPAVLAQEANILNAPFIHYSTDYVFDGTATQPYREDDPVNPINTYGRTKLAGEQAVQQVGKSYLILRTSWVYSFRRPSFASKVLEWARKQEEMKVVVDQTGSPTWCRTLAEVTAQVLAMGRNDPYSWLEEKKGLYHLAGDGCVNRYEFAQAALKNDPHPQEQLVKRIIPAYTADFPTLAVRPLYSGLNCDLFASVFNLRLPNWETALSMALAS